MFLLLCRATTSSSPGDTKGVYWSLLIPLVETQESRGRSRRQNRRQREPHRAVESCTRVGSDPTSCELPPDDRQKIKLLQRSTIPRRRVLPRLVPPRCGVRPAPPLRPTHPPPAASSAPPLLVITLSSRARTAAFVHHALAPTRPPRLHAVAPSRQRVRYPLARRVNHTLWRGF